ncbi:flagellar biosynthetic protein FliO [Bacillus tuaregi]|uniref:flagellar biosynthetic protein FliO n=1 Tax=Bacillus tuaregi TaxID=1816695 RepID=UPI0008F9198B|nr:flagellar biosynthetic protein FliO [Bacillus tuaregi]
MLRNKQFCFIVLFCVFALLGFQVQASAEQVNQSVKDCLEQPDTCGEQQEINQNVTADDMDSTQDKATSPIGLTIWDFFKMILATIFVIALLYLILKFVNKKGQLFKSSQLIENLGGTTLGANRSVQLIKVGNRILVVGVGENVQLIKEIDKPEEFNELLSAYNVKMDQLTQPGDLISKVLKKGGTTDKKGGDSAFQALMKKQLYDLSKGRQKLYDEIEKEKGSDKQ